MRSTRLVLAHYRFGAILQCRLGLYDKPGRRAGVAVTGLSYPRCFRHAFPSWASDGLPIERPPLSLYRAGTS